MNRIFRQSVLLLSVTCSLTFTAATAFAQQSTEPLSNTDKQIIRNKIIIEQQLEANKQQSLQQMKQNTIQLMRGNVPTIASVESATSSSQILAPPNPNTPSSGSTANLPVCQDNCTNNNATYIYSNGAPYIQTNPHHCLCPPANSTTAPGNGSQLQINYQ